MTARDERPTVRGLPTPSGTGSRVPAVLTRVVWLLCAASGGALVLRAWSGDTWRLGPVGVDGLTVVMWVTVTFFSGIVHSYSRRYMAGDPAVGRFFGRVFGFTLVVMVLVAARHLLVFWAAWLSMGLMMANLIGHVRDWPQAQAAAGLARRYFFAGGAALGVALGVLWWRAGATTVPEATAAVATLPSSVTLVVAGALLLAAMVQSALVPFHTWLLSSMTAPTPASALMHAGFVNAGGILLVRFAPVVRAEPWVLLVVAAVGTVSAIAGKLLKTVRTDVKAQLGCSTVGQMGFMITQVGLGFFAAAIAHLILHGFYKAYQFLASGGQVARESPTKAESAGSSGPLGYAVIAVTALAGGVLFAVLTGKATEPTSGLVLTLLVVLTVMHATRELVADASLPSGVRYGTVPLVALPAIAVYGAVFRAIRAVLSDLPGVGAPVALNAGHGVLALAFVVAYVAIERDAYQYSQRLYVLLVNATQAPPTTAVTATEEYSEQ